MSWTATMTVEEGEVTHLDIGNGIGAKYRNPNIPEDKPIIPVKWEIGAKHPKTGKRTRMFRTRDA